jgi:DNA-directed RNA polymerase subunit RPC12/RpoP
VGLVRPIDAEPRRCPSCGFLLAGPQGSQQFCEHCGARLV